MQIEIFSDIVCPWCYIGKRRLDGVLAGELGADVELVWRPYQLYPELPAQGINRDAFILARNPGAQDLAGLRAKIPSRIRAEAEDVGLQFDFAAMQYMPNTRLAHRLLDYGATHDVQHELAEVLFSYHFCEGRNVGEPAVLGEAAAELGLDAACVAAFLAGDDGVVQLDAQLERGIELGVGGVPCFVFANGFMLPGAQQPEVIEQFITRAKERFG